MREVSTEDLIALRSANLLQESEVAFYSGDLVIAENVLTKERRVLDRAVKTLLEGRKELLKG